MQKLIIKGKKELSRNHSTEKYANSLIDIVNNLDWIQQRNIENMIGISSDLAIPFGENSIGKNVAIAIDDVN